MFFCSDKIRIEEPRSEDVISASGTDLIKRRGTETRKWSARFGLRVNQRSRRSMVEEAPVSDWIVTPQAGMQG